MNSIRLCLVLVVVFVTGCGDQPAYLKSQTDDHRIMVVFAYQNNYQMYSGSPGGAIKQKNTILTDAWGLNVLIASQVFKLQSRFTLLSPPATLELTPPEFSIWTMGFKWTDQAKQQLLDSARKVQADSVLVIGTYVNSDNIFGHPALQPENYGFYRTYNAGDYQAALYHRGAALLYDARTLKKTDSVFNQSVLINDPNKYGSVEEVGFEKIDQDKEAIYKLGMFTTLKLLSSLDLLAGGSKGQ